MYLYYSDAEFSHFGILMGGSSELIHFLRLRLATGKLAPHLRPCSSNLIFVQYFLPINSSGSFATRLATLTAPLESRLSP